MSNEHSDSEIEEAIETMETMDQTLANDTDDNDILLLGATGSPQQEVKMFTRCLTSVDGKMMSGMSCQVSVSHEHKKTSVRNELYNNETNQAKGNDESSSDEVDTNSNEKYNSRHSSFSSCLDSLDKGCDSDDTVVKHRPTMKSHSRIIQFPDGKCPIKDHIYGLKLFASYFVATSENSVLKVELQAREEHSICSPIKVTGVGKMCRIGKTSDVAVLQKAKGTCTIWIIKTETFRICYKVGTPESVYNGIAYLMSYKAIYTEPKPKHAFAVWYTKQVGGNTYTDHVDELTVMAKTRGHLTHDTIVELLEFDPCISSGIHCAEAFGKDSIIMSSGNNLTCYKRVQTDGNHKVWKNTWTEKFEKDVSCICVSDSKAYIAIKNKRQILVFDKDGKSIDDTGLPKQLNVDPELVDVYGDKMLVVSRDTDSLRTVLVHHELQT